MKKNKTGLIIIIIAILCLVGGALYLFFGTDMFKKKEEPKEDKKEEEKETFELGKSELNGVYEKDGITIKLFEVAKNSVYFDYEVEGLGVSLPLKLRNGKATGDIFDDTYTVVIKDKEIELTSNSEEVEKGTYTKTKTYTKEDFYKDQIGDPELLNSEYNGIYDKDGTKLYMYQTEEDTVYIDVSIIENGSWTGFGKYYEIQEDGSLKEDLVFEDDEVESELTLEDNTVTLKIFDEENYGKLNGTYTKNGTVSIDYLIEKLG